MALSARIKILVIDDIAEQRTAVKQMLKQMGFKNIHDSSSAKESLKILAEGIKNQEPVQLIICDYQMPEVSGLDFLLKVQENEHLKQVPFLLMTGASDQEEIKNAVSHGVKNILLKPFSAESLKEKIAIMFKQV